MTFDMNRAWDEAVRMLKTNRELVLILAGLFFFLPVFAIGIFVPEIITGPSLSGATSIEQAAQIIADYNARIGHWSFLIRLAELIGMLSILALFARRRLTVAQAIGTGAKALIPFVIAAFFFLLSSSALGGLLVSILGYAGLLLVFILMLFAIARLTPLPSLLVAESRFNPFAAIADSWRMTGKSGWKILGFLLLIILAYVIVSFVVGGIILLATALISNVEAANLIAAALAALVNAFWLSLLMAILMAIYRQLNASGSATGIPRTHS